MVCQNDCALSLGIFVLTFMFPLSCEKHHNSLNCLHAMWFLGDNFTLLQPSTSEVYTFIYTKQSAR